MLDFTFLPLYLVEVKVNFTKYCRLPGSEWLNFGCYFSYVTRKFLNGMFRTCEGQFIHRLDTENGGKERNSFGETPSPWPSPGGRGNRKKERRCSQACGRRLHRLNCQTSS